MADLFMKMVKLGKEKHVLPDYNGEVTTNDEKIQVVKALIMGLRCKKARLEAKDVPILTGDPTKSPGSWGGVAKAIVGAGVVIVLGGIAYWYMGDSGRATVMGAFKDDGIIGKTYVWVKGAADSWVQSGYEFLESWGLTCGWKKWKDMIAVGKVDDAFAEFLQNGIVYNCRTALAECADVSLEQDRNACKEAFKTTAKNDGPSLVGSAIGLASKMGSTIKSARTTLGSVFTSAAPASATASTAASTAASTTSLAWNGKSPMSNSFDYNTTSPNYGIHGNKFMFLVGEVDRRDNWKSYAATQPK